MIDQPKTELSEHMIYSIMWTVIFGAALALGGSALEPFPLPFLNITAASPYVALLVTLNKVVTLKRFSVTAMYAVASVIAVFTTYLGPPTPLKPIYILAGLTFDLATLLRTDNLRLWNILAGHAAITISGFSCFWLIIRLMVPAAATAVGKLLIVAAPVHFAASVVIATLVWRHLTPHTPPRFVSTIRSQIGS